MEMLFHVYQGKNISFAGINPIILELKWHQAQCVTSSQVPPGKAAQGAGGKARAGRKGCCLHQIPLFPHYKYKQQKKGVRGLVLVMQKGKAEQEQPGLHVSQQNVEDSTHVQHPGPSKAGSGC